MEALSTFRESLSALQFDISSERLEKIKSDNKVARIQKLRVEIEYYVATSQFQYAALLVTKCLERSDKVFAFSFVCLMLRCLYFADKYQEARDLVRLFIDRKSYSKSEISILFSIMVEFDDAYVVYYLSQLNNNEGQLSPDPDFLTDRPIFFGVPPSKMRHPEKKYVFVGGTPRSGTSALGVFLNYHPELAMTVERYGYVQGFHPAMFDPDSHSRKLKGDAKSSFLEKRLNAQLIGDKRPNFLFGWFLTKKHFRPQDIKIVHLTRSPYLIAESYNKRALLQANGKGTWGSLPYSPRDKVYAVRDVNINNKYIEEIKSDSRYSSSLLVADSSEIYADEKKLLEVMDWLGLSITKSIREKARSVVDVSKSYKVKERFTKETFEYVNKNLDWCRFDRVFKSRDI